MLHFDATPFYDKIVNDVIDKMRADFVNEGISEDLLVKLKKVLASSYSLNFRSG